MKNRIIAAVFAVCLVSSLGFADSPSDAPLMPDDNRALPAPPDNTKNDQHHRRSKNNNPSSQNATNQNCPKSDHPADPATNAPADTNSSSAL